MNPITAIVEPAPRPPGRPRLPVGPPRIYEGREARTICVATTLAPDEVADLDRAAAELGVNRSECIRRAVRAAIAKATHE